MQTRFNWTGALAFGGCNWEEIADLGELGRIADLGLRNADWKRHLQFRNPKFGSFRNSSRPKSSILRVRNPQSAILQSSEGVTDDNLYSG